MSDKRTFTFFRAGGFDQVRLESGRDLQALGELDQKLWVALACPTKGLSFDARTLELIDADKDGRIRAPGLIAAAKWACAMLKNPDELVKPGDALLLSSINTDVEEGKRVHQAAKTVLAGLGRPNAPSISVKDSAEAVKAFEGMAFNGDGVVPPESAKDEAGKQLLADIVACTGGTLDKSGKQGASADNADAFFKAIAEHAAWLDKGTAETQPLGADTAAAFEAVKAVRAKVEDYFARCRLAAFDERAIAALNREEKEYLALAAKDLTITSAEIQSFPLARIGPGRALPLKTGVNPAWAAAVAALAEKAVKPLVGEKAELTEADWAAILAKLAPYEAWQGGKGGPSVEKLGAERVRALAKDGARKLFDDLMAEEKAQEPTAKSIASVEKLVRLHRDLFRLANNFVSFRDFYARKAPAIFQVGRLFLDQRECELCVRVEDAGKHATMAPLSRAYLAYCDCTRPATGEKMTIVAAFTAGDSDNLMVGRNGIFYDLEGRDWDATITRVVENPISLRQAFWAPYKKLLRFIEEQVTRRATAADTAANDKLTAGAIAVEKSADTGQAEGVPRKFDVGVVAALGVAVGGIAAALGAMLQTFFGLGMWMPLGFVGLMLVISGPSMLIAALKLRQRNIGPILDANGWAVNARARLNIPFGGALTKVAKLPPGSSVDTVDPFAEKRRPWGLYLTLAVILALGLAWYLGKLDTYLPAAARSVEVLGKSAPAWVGPRNDAPKADVPPPAAP
jgi:hypothetical protein